jgi:hypothetical protein
MEILNNKYEVVDFIAGSGGVSAGELVTISSATVITASGGESANTIVGIALEDADAADLVPVAVPEDGAIIQAEYTGISKTTLADTDIGTVFDVSDGETVDLDDTTGGLAVCVGYNNDVGIIKFMIPKTFRYL